jgi:hypothetical protein
MTIWTSVITPIDPILPKGSFKNTKTKRVSECFFLKAISKSFVFLDQTRDIWSHFLDS